MWEEASQLLMASSSHASTGHSCPQVALQAWYLTPRPLVPRLPVACAGTSLGLSPCHRLAPPCLVEPACSRDTLSS